MSTTRYPCALTIAGSDSSGGAGIQADLKTFAAHGVYGASVITAVTAQNTLGVRAIHDIPTDVVAAQIDAVLEDIPIAAVKIGMLSSPEIIQVVANRLRAHRIGTIVLDPVMVAKGGNALLKTEAVQALINDLVPMATLLTPNLPEAAALGKCEAISDPLQAVSDLLTLGPEAILLKGGHGHGDDLIDILAFQDVPPIEYRHRRISTPHTHGTGCSLSSAITANMAKGLPLTIAVELAIDWLQKAIVNAWPLGAGHGPVHHFWQSWSEQA